MKDRRRSLYRRDFRKLRKVISIRSRLSTKFIGCLVKPSHYDRTSLPATFTCSRRITERVASVCFIRVTWRVDRSILKSCLGSQREQALNFTIKAESDPCASCCILQRRLAPVTSKFRWRWRTGHRNFGIVLSFMSLHLGKLSYPFYCSFASAVKCLTLLIA